MADDLSEIVESFEISLVATGFVFTEGPVWHPEGYLLFTEIGGPHQIWKVIPGETKHLERDGTGRATGLTFDLYGNLIACEQETRQVTKTNLRTGEVEPIATHCQGKQLYRPNDVVGRSDGSLYFTNRGAPGGSEKSDGEMEHNGVYRIAPDGSVNEVVYPYVDPNGLALSPDERVLYLVNTRPSMHLDAFDVLPDGSLVGGHRFFQFPGGAGDVGVPDGVKVDVEGRIYCTGPGGIWVIDSGGDMSGVIRFPEPAVNMGWGDADNRTLYVAARTSVYSIRMRTPGTLVPRA